MLNLTPNIDSNERVTRAVIGAILVIAAILGMGRVFLFLAGAVLVAEAFMSWCFVPIISEKLKLAEFFKKKDGTPKP